MIIRCYISLPPPYQKEGRHVDVRKPVDVRKHVDVRNNETCGNLLKAV